MMIGLQALSLGVIAYATFPNAFHFHALDLLIYHESARALLRGTWPAVEGRMVYPPLALVPFSLPHLLAALAGHSLDLQGYARLWPIVNIGFSVAISLLLSQFSPSFAPPSRTRLFWYTVFAILSGPILLWKYDLFPTFLTVGAALALWKRRPFTSGLCLGAAIAAKLYPLFLLPVCGLYLWHQEERTQTLRFLLGTAAAAVLPFLPFALFQPRLLWTLLAYHTQRGLEIESLYAGWLALLHHLGLAEARPVLQYGTWDIASPLSALLLRWQPFVFAAVYVGCLWNVRRKFRQAQALHGRIGENLLMAALLVGVMAFIITGKVFSPQYILWLLPFGTFLRPRHLLLFLLVVLLTVAEFPFLFDDLTLLKWGPVVIVNLRNTLMIALLVWLVCERPPSPETGGASCPGFPAG